MGPSLFHRHTYSQAPESTSQPIHRSGLAMTGLAAFSSSGLPPRSNFRTDNLAFVPYTAPIRPREAQAMGDISYELAHPSKFSDWTDDGDEHALPPPSLGIALLSKARAAIKASREAVTTKYHDDIKVSGSGLPSSTARSRAPILAPSSLSGFRSRGPTIVNPPIPKPESPLHRWLDLGACTSPTTSPKEIRPSSPASKGAYGNESPRVTAFQFLEGANQLSSPSRIRRQTDISNTAKSYSQMMQAQERSQAQVSFVNRYPDFEVGPNQAGPSKPRLTPATLGRAFEPQESPRAKARRTTTSSILRTWDQAEVVPADRILHRSGTQKSSSCRKGKDSMFLSFRRKGGSRSGKARAEDIDRSQDVEPGRSSQTTSSGRRSLPPVRGLRNMFSMEPIIQIDARPSPGLTAKRSEVPPDKPLSPSPNDCGVIIRHPTHQIPAQSKETHVVTLNSPPLRTESLPGKPRKRDSSRNPSSCPLISLTP